MRPFGEAQSKATRAYAQSGQYHTIVKSRFHLIELLQMALESDIGRCANENVGPEGVDCEISH